MKRIYVLVHAEARRRASAAVMAAPDGYVVRLSPPTRTLEANAKMWSMLGDVARQVVWHGRKLDAESWKHIFSSILKKQDVVPNLDGTGFVVLGQSTSSFTKAEMSDMIELIYSFGAEHGVVWGDDGRMAE
jgi:hypothetical protein